MLEEQASLEGDELEALAEQASQQGDDGRILGQETESLWRAPSGGQRPRDRQ